MDFPEDSEDSMGEVEPANPSTPLLLERETDDHRAASLADPSYYKAVLSVESAIEHGIFPELYVGFLLELSEEVAPCVTLTNSLTHTPKNCSRK